MTSRPTGRKIRRRMNGLVANQTKILQSQERESENNHKLFASQKCCIAIERFGLMAARSSGPASHPHPGSRANEHSAHLPQAEGTNRTAGLD